VIVHHPTKAGGARGSGNLLASVERVIEVAAPDDKSKRSWIVVRDEKGNHTSAFEDFTLEFQSVALDVDHKGEAITSAILTEAQYDPKLSQTLAPSNTAAVYAWLLENPEGGTPAQVRDGANLKGEAYKSLYELRDSGRAIQDGRVWKVNKAGIE
jgi:hypothetical protein